jgi:hypothetical protein
MRDNTVGRAAAKWTSCRALTSDKRNGPRKITLRPLQLGRPFIGTVLRFSLKNLAYRLASSKLGSLTGFCPSLSGIISHGLAGSCSTVAHGPSIP